MPTILEKSSELTAGREDEMVVSPEELEHPPEYDPRGLERLVEAAHEQIGAKQARILNQTDQRIYQVPEEVGIDKNKSKSIFGKFENRINKLKGKVRNLSTETKTKISRLWAKNSEPSEPSSFIDSQNSVQEIIEESNLGTKEDIVEDSAATEAKEKEEKLNIVLEQLTSIIDESETAENLMAILENLKSNKILLSEALQDEHVYSQILPKITRAGEFVFNRKKDVDSKKYSVYIRLVDFCASLAAENLPDIDRHITEGESDVSNHSLNAIFYVIEAGSRAQKDAALEFALNHLPKIEQDLRSSLSGATYHLDMLYKHGGSEAKEKLNLFVEGVWGKVTDRQEKIKLASFLCDSDQQEVRELGDVHVKELLAEYNLEPESTLQVWRASGPGIYRTIQKNFKVMDEIEAASKGIEGEPEGVVSFLQKEYGICDFYRYPPELLLRQYQEHDNLDLEYAMVIYPKDDHNGEFSKDAQLFESIDQQTKGKMAVRIFECSSRVDVARAFLKLKHKYQSGDNKDSKISFALIGGHGTPDSIQLSSNYIMKEDFDGKGAVKIKDFFKEDASIVLWSCSTGAEGGIGQKLSEKFGLNVIAPNIPTHIRSLDLEWEQDGKLKVQAEYADTDSKMKYAAGQRVS